MANKQEKPADSVLVICAHSDDQVLGVGGTIAKYAEEGKEVNVIVASFGEKSHPWLKKEVITETRVKESQKAAKMLGISNTVFFGLEETKFKKEFTEKKAEPRLAEILKKYKPSKIFTHSPDDPLPDHNALSDFVIEFCRKTGYNKYGDVYCFDIWNPVNIKKRDLPKMVVDISNTFKTKLRALRCFKSQKWNAIVWLTLGVYWRAIKNGRQNNCKYAEVFYKIS